MSYIAKIHECKGRQELFTRQKPVELNRLIKIARVQSTEASNKTLVRRLSQHVRLVVDQLF